METDLLRGEWINPSLGQITLGDWAQRWMATKVNLKASTRESYESLLRSRILPRWKDVKLAAVEHADIAARLAELSAEGLSASRIRKCQILLSQILALAVRDGRLTRNVATGVDLPRITRVNDRRYLTHDEAQDLAEAWRAWRSAPEPT